MAARPMGVEQILGGGSRISEELSCTFTKETFPVLSFPSPNIDFSSRFFRHEAKVLKPMERALFSEFLN